MLLIKPDTMYFAPRVTRLGREGHGCVLSACACFSIAEADEHALREEGAMWRGLIQALGEGGVFDEGFAKPRAEFLVYGRCHPPQGALAMEVRVTVGSREKRLQVFGQRFFDGRTPTPPRPLQPLRLDWLLAYGGPQCAENPMGKGHGELRQGDELPQVLVAGDHSDDLQHARPASLTACPPSWPLRARHLGAFDHEWLFRDWPELPAESSKEFFCTASEDQRLAGHFAGNEPLTVEGMHPERGVIHSSLPGLRSRLFVQRKGAQGLEEVQARADTLWLLPEHELAVLCYRGVVPVEDDEAGDLHAFVGGWEPLSESPLPLSHYQALLHQEEWGEAEIVQDAPQPTADTAPEPEPRPDTAPLQPPAAPQLPEGVLQELEALTAGFAATAQRLLAEQGLAEADALRLLDKGDASFLTKDFDMQAFSASLERQASELLAERGLAEQDLQRLLQQAARPMQGAELERFFDAMAENTELQPTAAEGRQALADFEAIMERFDQLDAAPRDDVAYDSAEAHGKPAFPEAATAANAKQKRDLRKANFRNADLEGRDFSGADLAGADFSGARLQEACFHGASCLGADFEGALAHGADFSEADLRHCRFPHADCSKALFSNARMEGVVLEYALLQGAEMQMVTASETYGPHVDFNGADLSGADFSNSLLSHADFSDCDLGHARLYESMLDQAAFYGANCRGIRLRGACLHGMRADKASDFRQADWRLADLTQARLLGCDCREGNFWGALLNEASLEGVCLAGCVLKGVAARRVVLDKADCTGASLRHSNFFRASLRKTRLQNVRVEHTSLFGADLYGAHTDGTILENANIERTLLDPTMPRRL